MRCPDCSKMVSLDFGDPEIEDFSCSVELDDEGNLVAELSASARIVRSCADCGTELKEATLDLSYEGVALGHDLLVGALGGVAHVEAVPEGERGGNTPKPWRWAKGHSPRQPGSEPDSVDQVEEGGGRYKKSYFGACVSVEVECECGEVLCTVEATDKVAASAMDEMV